MLPECDTVPAWWGTSGTCPASSRDHQPKWPQCVAIMRSTPPSANAVPATIDLATGVLKDKSTGPVEFGPATQLPARPNGSRHPHSTVVRVGFHY